MGMNPGIIYYAKLSIGENESIIRYLMENVPEELIDTNYEVVDDEFELTYLNILEDESTYSSVFEYHQEDLETLDEDLPINTINVRIADFGGWGEKIMQEDFSAAVYKLLSFCGTRNIVIKELFYSPYYR